MHTLHRALAVTALSLILILTTGVANAHARFHHRANLSGATNNSVVPEIDPSSLGSVSALLAGGLLLLRGRRRR